MTLSNRDLVKRFIKGKSSGHACNMEIQELEIDDIEKGTILVDYGWAILAHRSKKGTITLFDKWYGYSQTTSTHINIVRPHANRIDLEHRVCRVPRYGYTSEYTTPSKWGKSFPYPSELEQRVSEV